MSLTVSCVAIKWLLPGSVTVYRQGNHFNISNHHGQLTLLCFWGR